MGHTRLGSIPKTRKWADIVATIANAGPSETSGRGMLSEDVREISRQTIDAASGGLYRIIDDPGLRYTFYLLTKIVSSSRESDWQQRWVNLGIDLSEDATLFDLTAEMQNAIDKYLSRYALPTDISEMAQQAAGEALATLAGPKSMTLFGCGKNEMRLAVRELSTKAGFAHLSQVFFGRFMARFLNFYISRVTTAHVGGDRLHQVVDLTRFNQDLRLHCEQSARIVYDFSGEWYSKTQFKEGINLDNTSRFLAVALKKLQAELGQQRTES
jgi:hypothetical protein